MPQSKKPPHPGWSEWPVMNVTDLGDPDARGFGVGGGEWPFRGFVVRRDGALFAYANVCPHARHPLDMLPDDLLVAEGNLLRCASHGALFLPDSGECIAGPCTGLSLLVLDCREDVDGTIFVRAPGSMQEIDWSTAW